VNRIARSLYVFALALAAAGAARAQDVVAVAGDSHKVIFENDQVRVLSVRLAPGQKAPMHAHPANVAYYLSGGKLRVTTPDGKSVEKTPKAGTAGWADPVTHAVENIGTSDFTQVQIELKRAPQGK
jgi:quercetin dioxygenase-like cupin family protein